MELEDKESNVYGDEAREDLEENDEITPEEDAFMKGYDEEEDDEDDIEEDEDYEQTFS